MKSHFPRRAAALLLALVLAFSLALPAAAADPDDPDPTPPTFSVSLPSTLELEVGEDEDLSASFNFSDSYEDDYTFEWTSSDGSIATVRGSSDNATVHAAGEGTATITLKVTHNDTNTDKEATCTVTVKPVTIKSISLDQQQLTLTQGETATLRATTNPETASIEWSSSDNTVVRVDRSGNITTVKAGTATITATATLGDSTKSAACRVTVLPYVDSVELTYYKLTLAVGETYNMTRDLTVKMTDNSTYTGKVAWTSANPAVAAIDESSGLVSGVSAGETTITATAGGKSATRRVQVTAAATQPSVSLSPTSYPASGYFYPGSTFDLTATITGVDASEAKWTVSNSSIIAFKENPDGAAKATVEAKGAGRATVTVTAGGKSASCVVVVTAYNASAATSVKISEPQATFVDQKGTLDLTAVVTPGTATTGLNWYSSNTSVMTIAKSADGDRKATVTGIAPGEATITVATDDGKFRDSIKLEVSGVTLEKKTLSLYINRSETLVYHLYGSVKNATPTWTAVNPSIADASPSGRVTGHYVGSTDVEITAGKYTATCTVTVSEDLAQAIERNMGSRATFSFADILTELGQRSQTKTESPLSSINNLEVSTKNGILYYSYTSPSAPGHGVGGSERYYASPSQGQRAIKDITFVPKAGAAGTAVINYSGEGTNGLTFNGTIRITSTTTGDITYRTAAKTPLKFSAGDFSSICQTKTGKAVSYVTFEQPVSSRGTLYYNYSSGSYSQKVDSATRYYVNGNPAISNVTFLPADNYTGPVNVTYHCTDTSGASFTGNIAITVYAPSNSGAGNVEYTATIGERVRLSASDFQDVCRTVTDRNLDYIRFTSLPSTANGVLYYNYSNSNSSRVTTSTNYYRNSSPYISSITLVPASSFAGSIVVPFTGYTVSGGTFNGNLVVRYGDSADGDVTYSTRANQPVSFVASDFNSACQRANDASLNRISFTPPSTSSGTLYYNYSSSSSTGTRVTSSDTYYRSGSPSISNITFVPAKDFNGTVSIPFSGYDSDGGRFSGRVRITVGTGRGSQTVTYSTVANGSVRFNASDFNSACNAITGRTLNYVRFDLPASRYGTLYYQYNTSSNKGTSLSGSMNFYRTSSSSRRLLDDVTFVASSTTGTTTIHYTGYDVDGVSFTGNVEITVKSSSASSAAAITYTGSAAPISFRATDFQGACQAALGTSLSYIQFTGLPTFGLLTCGYTNNIQTGNPVTTSSRYYPNGAPDINQIVYRPKAETQGTISIPFTGYDANGGRFNSTVQIILSNNYAATSFTDLSGWDWARPSIEFLRQSGITNGYSNNQFRPGRSISRGEFTLMICRAFQFQTTAGASSFPDVPSSSVYAGAVAAAKNLGIVQGDNGRFKPNSPITRQSAMTMICRAIQAAGQSLPAASASTLSGYSDGNQVSNFARSSVASLIQIGAVRGTTDMRINPRASISRAEMAVILHRVLTR